MSAVEKLSLLKRLWIVVEKETTFQRTSRSAQFGRSLRTIATKFRLQSKQKKERLKAEQKKFAAFPDSLDSEV